MKTTTLVKIVLWVLLALFGLPTILILAAIPFIHAHGMDLTDFLTRSKFGTRDFISKFLSVREVLFSDLLQGALTCAAIIGCFFLNNQSRRFLRALLMLQIVWMLLDVGIAHLGIGFSFILEFIAFTGSYWFLGRIEVQKLFLPDPALWPKKSPSDGPPFLQSPLRYLLFRWKRTLAYSTIVLLLGVLLVNPVTAIFLYIHLSDVPLRMPWVYRPIARRLAVLCQSYPLGLPEEVNSVWFPGVKIKGAEDAHIGATAGHIGYGGGFYHFGYLLELDSKASNSQTNVWKLSIIREEDDPDPLWTFSLPVTETLPKEEVADTYEKGLKWQVTEAYWDNDQYCEKAILYFLKNGYPDRAADAAQKWVAAQPDQWLPHLIQAHVRSLQGEPDQASEALAQWADTRSNFAYYVVLAHFEYSQGKKRQALNALRHAANMPFVEYSRYAGGRDDLGVKGAHLALSCGDFKLCSMMCRKYLVPKREEYEWYTLYPLWRHLAAAEMMLGEKREALEAVERADQLIGNAGNADDLRRSDDVLRLAIKTGDRGYMKDPAHFTDTNFVWNDPFFANY